MPAQSPGWGRKAFAKTPRTGLPEPGIGGYDYPRGPFGATGYPGSTPASKRTHTQGQDGRKDRQLVTTQIWARDTGIEFLDVEPTRVPEPETSYSQVRFKPGTEPLPGNTYLRPNGSPRQPRARQMRSTSAERREIPLIGGAPGSQNVRNEIAQRYKARPGMMRAYRVSPNPGKTGAVLDGPSRYHPGTTVHGHPDGKPLPGMAPQPGFPPTVWVPSRYVSAEGSQEGYAVNRELVFTKGGSPADIPHGAAPHIRGARMSGLRYFGELSAQQQIGLESDAYGIVRKRGPRHRPVRFEQPPPHAANYYDEPAAQGTGAPDMIHRSPAAPRRSGVSAGRPRRG